ncbi:hypothetical protein VTK26DRAFT_5290 [Humicola hyalothermophila]
MAPPTGPRGGGGARKTAPRPSRGGGIAKRRPAIKTDRDGDVSMDGPVTRSNAEKAPSGPSGRGARSARGGRSNPAAARLAQNIKNHLSDARGRGQKSQHNKTVLKILGLKNSKAANNPDGGLRSLLDFLERKSSKGGPVTVGKGVIDGDYVYIRVNKDDAPRILQLNGYTYAGAPLTIEETTEPMPGHTGQSKMSQAAEETRQQMKAVVARRYNAQQKLLDLSSLGTDETLSSLGTFDSLSLAEKSFKALMHLAVSNLTDPEQKKEAMQSVSLASNDIQDVGQVYPLAFYLPHLRRLDLSNNKLENLSKLSKWRHEFRFLEELHLSGNPVVTQPNYAAEITQWFPSLQILDGQQVRTPEQAAEALKASYPTPLPSLPSNLRDGDNNVASTFLRSFFTLYDHDRTNLVSQFYDDQSWFSVTYVADSKQDPSAKSCVKFSRNIQALGTRNPSTMQRLFTGGNLIAELWTKLPATRHPSLDQPDQWLIDCHTFPHLANPSGHGFAMGLMINVNGQCEEADANEGIFGTRTYSRCFILGPSKPGAPHPYRVLSDQLTLHTWKPHNVNPGAAAVPTVDLPSVAPPVVSAPVLDDATKAQMIQELSARTGMNAQYSELCLTGAANWNFEMALQSFEAQKANIPPEAFIMPQA